MAVAAIDLDGDGWRDLCVATNNGPLRVFRHRKPPSPSPSPENGGGGLGISLSSKSATNWSQHNLALARQFIDSDQSEQSLPYLRRALKVAPRDPEALLLLANARRDQGRFGEAKTLLDRLRGQSGIKKKSLLIEEGRLFYSMKQYDRAAEILLQVVATSPSDQQAHLALAYVCLKQGRFEEAREHFLLAGARGGEDAKREEAGESR